MTTAEEFFRSLKSGLEAASESSEVNEAMERVIKAHYSSLFVKHHDNAVFVRKGESPWLCIRVDGPKKFKVSENRNAGGASLIDFVDGFDCSVDQVVTDIAKLAGR